MTTLRIRYFAWLRERIGLGEETVELPPDIDTVSDVVRWLQTRGEGYANAFEAADVVRAALDQVHVKPGQRLHGARELAFFPPMTGG